MDDATAMGVPNRLANMHELPQQLHKLDTPRPVGQLGIVLVMKRLNGISQFLASHEPHHVIAGSAGMLTATIDGNHARMFQAPSDLGLHLETFDEIRIMGVMRQQFL